MRDSKVQLSLHVSRDGKDLTELSPEQWEGFVRELIPPEISALYFFDAEKIKEIANETLGAEVLRASVRGLLGLELVERLQSDLSILSSKFAKSVNGDDRTREADRLQRELTILDEKLELTRQNLGAFQSQLGNLRAQFERASQEFQRLGGGYSLSRRERELRREQVVKSLDGIEEHIRLDSGDLLPFALAPRLCGDVIKRLDTDRRLKAEKLGLEWIRSMGPELEKELETLPAWDAFQIDVAGRKTLIGGFFAAMSESRSLRLSDQLLHDVALATEELIRKSLVEAPFVAKRVQTLATEHEALTRELEYLESMLRLAPSEDVLLPAHERMLALQREIGSLEQSVTLESERLASLRHERDGVAREYSSIKERAGMLDAIHSKVGMISKVSALLTDYSDQLSKVRAVELQRYIRECHTMCVTGLVSRDAQKHSRQASTRYMQLPSCGLSPCRLAGIFHLLWIHHLRDSTPNTVKDSLAILWRKHRRR